MSGPVKPSHGHKGLHRTPPAEVPGPKTEIGKPVAEAKIGSAILGHAFLTPTTVPVSVVTSKGTFPAYVIAPNDHHPEQTQTTLKENGYAAYQIGGQTVYMTRQKQGSSGYAKFTPGQLNLRRDLQTEPPLSRVSTFKSPEGDAVHVFSGPPAKPEAQPEGTVAIFGDQGVEFFPAGKAPEVAKSTTPAAPVQIKLIGLALNHEEFKVRLGTGSGVLVNPDGKFSADSTLKLPDGRVLRGQEILKLCNSIAPKNGRITFGASTKQTVAIIESSPIANMLEPVEGGTTAEKVAFLDNNGRISPHNQPITFRKGSADATYRGPSYRVSSFDVGAQKVLANAGYVSLRHSAGDGQQIWVHHDKLDQALKSQQRDTDKLTMGDITR